MKKKLSSPIVILSGVAASPREAAAQSKDLYPHCNVKTVPG